MAHKSKLNWTKACFSAANAVAAHAATHASFRTLSATSLAACMMLGVPTQAAGINTEAASPNGIQSSRGLSKTVISRVTIRGPLENDGVPDRNWGGPRTVEVPLVHPQMQRLAKRAIGTVPRRQTTNLTQTIDAPNKSEGGIRRVIVPVLGREVPLVPVSQTPAIRPARSTVNAPAPVRQIAINASEPILTSIVRPRDVQPFQKIGAPYQVNGMWYVPAHEPDYDETGTASWYGSEFHGRPTANGEMFDMNVVSAAHPTLPIPSLVEVTNLANGRSLVVRVNDRGPFVAARLIDLSARGAELLGFQREGHAQVRVRYVGPADNEPMVTSANLTPTRRLTSKNAVTPLSPSQAPQPTMWAGSSTPNQTSPDSQAFVQVGAFAQRANADRAREQMTNLGVVQVVETANADGSPLFRVVLGPVANRAAASEKAMEMSSIGFAGARVLASLD